MEELMPAEYVTLYSMPQYMKIINCKVLGLENNTFLSFTLFHSLSLYLILSLSLSLSLSLLCRSLPSSNFSSSPLSLCVHVLLHLTVFLSFALFEDIHT